MNRANNDSKVYKIMFFVREKGLAVETMAACRCLPVDNVMWGFYRFVGSARERTSDSPDFHVPLFMCNHVPRGHLGGDIGDENCTRLWIPEPMRILTLMTIMTDAPPHAKACRKRAKACPCSHLVQSFTLDLTLLSCLISQRYADKSWQQLLY